MQTAATTVAALLLLAAAASARPQYEEYQYGGQPGPAGYDQYQYRQQGGVPPGQFGGAPTYILDEEEGADELSFLQRLVRPWTWFSGWFGGGEEETSEEPYRPEQYVERHRYRPHQVARYDQYYPQQQQPQQQQYYPQQQQYQPQQQQQFYKNSRSDPAYTASEPNTREKTASASVAVEQPTAAKTASSGQAAAV